jgi:hypothetical protein
MSNSNGSGNNEAIGCAILFLIFIAFSIVGFIVEYVDVYRVEFQEILLEVLLPIGVVIAVMVAITFALRFYVIAVAKAPPKEKSMVKGKRGPKVVKQARAAGKNDMRTAWMQYQLGTLPAQATHSGTESIANMLGVVPRSDWSVSQLRKHGRAMCPLRTSARQINRHQELDAHLDRVAAMISDLTTDTFDTKDGQNRDEYLYHQHRSVREAYMEGGALGVEAIMDTITAARVQAQEEATLRAGADSAAERRNAALKALRETHRSTENRDAQAAWEAKAKDLGL